MSKKSASASHYRADIVASGTRRIDGVVRACSEAGVTIDVRVPGRRVYAQTLIPMSNVLCHTAVGPGFVICEGSYLLEPIAGEVVEEGKDGVVLKDADGVEIIFPHGTTRSGTNFVVIDGEDRALKRGNVETRIVRLSERDGSGKARKVKEKSAKANKKMGKRRKI